MAPPVRQGGSASRPWNARLHWALALMVFIIDVLLVGAIIWLDREHPTLPPKDGIDTSAAIGWVSVCGSIFIFGTCTIFLKTPSVIETQCDCMVFQNYWCAGTVVVSTLIWMLASGSTEGVLTGSSVSMGVLFGVMWNCQSVGIFCVVQKIGFSVASTIYIAVGIITSVIWGVAAFKQQPRNWIGAMFSFVVMVVGTVLVCWSSILSERHVSRSAALRESGKETNVARSARVSGLAFERQDSASPCSNDRQESRQQTASTSVRAVGLGAIMAVGIGIIIGSKMVTLNCFSNGCSAIGVTGYVGDTLAPLAFLPSLSLGIAISQSVLFLFYWSIVGSLPELHFKLVFLPGFLTGVFWGMGNFGALFATAFLGQTVGFPLTQCALVVTGMWGILYHKEVQGVAALCTWVLAAILILGGACMVGQFA